MSPDVTVDVDAGVAVLTLNRPERLNAYTADMGALLSRAYSDCDCDDEVRAIVVTGAGDAFCAGADFSGDAGPFDTPADGFSASPITPAAFELRKPVIAAVNGHAIGIGLTIALQADLRIVAEDAKYGVVQVRRGVLPDCMSHWTLAQLTTLGVAAFLERRPPSFTSRLSREWTPLPEPWTPRRAPTTGPPAARRGRRAPPCR